MGWREKKITTYNTPIDISDNPLGAFSVMLETVKQVSSIIGKSSSYMKDLWFACDSYLQGISDYITNILLLATLPTEALGKIMLHHFWGKRKSACHPYSSIPRRKKKRDREKKMDGLKLWKAEQSVLLLTAKKHQRK